ncbi:hypothetical protein DPMN_030740 [Dreissena polymorpha]|uniref:Uncharacterized protein n=1 Tax=Dreissena polymorpha TaxID=45954 RepID=A0A9D4M1G8_DREPO|nr:hypothetical protein DPMN_030740 [Dreissena polymorpha]
MKFRSSVVATREKGIQSIDSIRSLIAKLTRNSTEHTEVRTDFDESTNKMLANEQGKVRRATDRRDLVLSAMNRYDRTTNPLRSGTIKYDLTTDPLRSSTGKYELERPASKQWELRRTGTDR